MCSAFGGLIPDGNFREQIEQIRATATPVFWAEWLYGCCLSAMEYRPPRRAVSDNGGPDAHLKWLNQ